MPYIASGDQSTEDGGGTFGTFGNVLERGWNVPLPLVCLAL